MDTPTATLPHDDPVSLLASTDLFKAVEIGVLENLRQDLETVALPEGSALFRQGDPIDSLYILLSGSLRVAITQEDGGELVVATVGPGEVLGEMQILTGGERTASIYADREAELLRLTREAFDRLAERHPVLIHEVAAVILRRLRRNQLVAALPALFGPLDEEQLREIESALEWVHVPRGEYVFRKGDPGDGLFVLVSGRLRAVIVDDQGNERVLSDMMRGESVGEMAVLTEEDRSADVYALRDSDLVKFPKASFDRLLAEHPDVIMQITKLIIRRLRRVGQTTRDEESITSVAVVPKGKAVPLSEFARRFTTAAARLGPVLHLNAERIESALGTPGIAQSPGDHPNSLRLAAWLNEQEPKYRFIVYETDVSASQWTSRCLRQADQVLIVDHASSDPEPGEIEAAFLSGDSGSGMTSHRRLVLLHPNGSQPPTGTLRWLERRKVEKHHHIRWDTERDLESLARSVAGRAVGLVLSGGGARGFAHIGVIQAMRDAGVPIDLVGGVSMGSMIGAECALDWASAAMQTRTAEAFHKCFNDYTFPFTSMVTGRKFNRAMQRLYGEAQIEDTWLPFFCITSNLTRAEITLHRTGSLWKHTRMSGSLPGLVPPVIVDGDLVFDGCLLNNLPMDVMRSECGNGTVVAVDVTPPVDMWENQAYGDSLSGWKVLWSKLNPFSRAMRVPSISAILQRAGELSSVYGRQEQIRRGMADLYVCPSVAEIGTLEFSRVDECNRLGYERAKEMFAEWLSDPKNQAVVSKA